MCGGSQTAAVIILKLNPHLSDLRGSMNLSESFSGIEEEIILTVEDGIVIFEVLPLLVPFGVFV